MGQADLEKFLDSCAVDDAVFALRPDYRVALIAVEGIEPGPSDETSEALLEAAEAKAAEWLTNTAPEALPHVASWREAYRAFGAKPQRTRNSLEALLRRTGGGLPRINRLTDIYNAISVMHQIPLGGEDLSAYVGPARLIRSDGSESFETMADGDSVIELPEPGEVIWCDDAGVTCRRWNWRQCRRTQLTDATTSALFILDGLDPKTASDMQAAADDLASHLVTLGPDVVIAQRQIARDQDVHRKSS